MNYADFIAGKSQYGSDQGFVPTWMPDQLFDFQKSLVDWSVRKGRSAIFASCGLGKTAMQLTWAENVVRHTNKPVLVLTPIAVGGQTVREGEKFGVDCVRSFDGTYTGTRVVIANYQRLHYFNQHDFAGVVCDESSILKDATGKTKAAVTDFMRTVPYRLLCTATAAPNDYVELGTSSEALGELGFQDMVTKFFKKQQSGGQHGWARLKYELKGHAVRDFWRWVCSWARAVRRPSDLGFSDDRYELPPLLTHEHTVTARNIAPGRLFDVPVETLEEQAEERRRTIGERCEKVAELVDHKRPAIAWCDLNPEGDMMEKLIPGSVQVSGKDSDEAKEEKLNAFASGQARVLVSKPSIAGFGLNFQHCADQTFFPSHSYEQYHQAVRRSWRFGQTKPVNVHLVTTEGAGSVLANLQRKSEQADAMFDQLVELMNDSIRVDRSKYGTARETLPTWLKS